MHETSVPWQRYQELFPQRYWQAGAFDNYVQAALHSSCLSKDVRRPLAVVDVACGTQGTPGVRMARQARKDFVWCAMDPYVQASSMAQWADRVLTSWDALEQADFKQFSTALFVVRGAINYFDSATLSRLAHVMERFPRALLLANTFVRPPPSTWQERPYAGGTERFRLSDDGKQVLHELVCAEGVLAHRFFYRPAEAWHQWFPGVRLTSTATNSYVLAYTAGPLQGVSHGPCI